MRFQVTTREASDARTRYLVVDSEDHHRPVAQFDRREEAQAHADRLEEGPFDWDEQEAWKDEWDQDDEERAAGRET